MAVLPILSLSLLYLISLTTISAAQNSGSTTTDGAKPLNSELWCVAKNDAEDAALQSALDWACGSGGANCSPIQPGGPCHDPSNIQLTASFAFNDYFLKNGLSKNGCNFDNTAALTSLNPSDKKCKFPSSLSVRNGSFTGTVSGEISPSSANLNNSNSLGDRFSMALIIVYLSFLISFNFFRV